MVTVSGRFFSLVSIQTQYTKQHWSRMKTLTSKATSRRTKTPYFKINVIDKSQPYLKFQYTFVKKVARRPMIFFRYFFQSFSNEHFAKT